MRVAGTGYSGNQSMGKVRENTTHIKVSIHTITGENESIENKSHQTFFTAQSSTSWLREALMRISIKCTMNSAQSGCTCCETFSMVDDNLKRIDWAISSQLKALKKELQHGHECMQ